jgi:hypothetical protein
MQKKRTSREKNWQTLVSFFPPDWEHLATETRAKVRLRGFRSVDALRRTLLLHVARGYSLRETVVRARMARLAKVSDVALLKRLRSAEEWFHALCVALLQEQGIEMPQAHPQVRLRLVDSTTIKEPGKTGSLWRVHYSFRVPELRCDAFTLTPTKGVGTGDSLTQFTIAPGDHLIADRGYCHANGIEHVVSNGGAILVRLNTAALPLFTAQGRRVPLLGRLAPLRQAGQIREWSVHIHGATRVIAGRVCAVRKTEEAIKRTEKQLRRNASKQGEVLQPETLEYAKYIIVFTTFDPLTVNAAMVLQWYRVRWQVAVSREGSITQSVQVRPRLTDSGLVAREAPGRESKPVKPSDNPLGREWAQRSRLQRAVNADVASLHAIPVAELVYYGRRQQGPGERGLQRRSSPAGYQR